ncbi:hypothetical protein QZH41_004542 [Actinostola sp. cb2023]|nr:hypothetical protein QZH41_004542 [Actinostola sp. cb2023]
MASTHGAPKQWCLSKVETVNSYENWKQNLLYTLSLDNNFAPFLTEGASWAKKTKAQPLRGFTDDGEDVLRPKRLTAQQKVSFLELMLGQIANYCPIIARNTLVKNSTSIEYIWQTIRQHFGFQVTGAQLIDFADIHLQPDERPEDLYQRLMAFVEDVLLKTNSISHHGEPMLEDEELTPTLENFIVLTWLRLINPELPKLVKQRYGTELRSRTLASIKPEISQALNSLLDEIHASDDAKIMRTAATSYRRPTNAATQYKPGPRPRRQEKSCPLCRQAGRTNYTHFLSECSFLPEQDRRYITKARQIVGILDDDSEVDNAFDTSPPDSEPKTHEPGPDSTVFRIQTCQSPYLDTFHAHHHVRITIDSGATGNMIRHSLVKRLGSTLTSSSQSAHQADGSSPLHVVGETRLLFTRDNRQFKFEGLVVENLDVDILAGSPFMETNDVTVRPAKRQVILGDGTVFVYGAEPPQKSDTAACRALLLRAPPVSTTFWPGEFMEIQLPSDAPPDSEYALEPRSDAPSVRRSNDSDIWPQPSIIASVGGKIRIPNLSTEPHCLKRNEHFCQASPVFIPTDIDLRPGSTRIEPPSRPKAPPPATVRHSAKVRLDPDNLLPQEVRTQFQSLLDEYDSVFDPNITGYNGAAGPFEAKVNMGPVEPPQRKGRLPQYSRGEFSASPRVSTFLSTVSRYQASVRHVSGAAILPSDFASRNAPICDDATCQVCSFIHRIEDSVVRSSSIQDFLNGDARLPFTSRPAWLATQSECSDLRRTHAHLTQGTRPSKKLTNVKDIKRYLNVATIARDGLLVVKREEPLAPTRECIIVPRQVLEGLLTALHIQLGHPSSHQLKMVTKRYLFALDIDKAIDRVTLSCHPCAALRQTPRTRTEQVSSAPPDAVGVSFAADVIKRSRQLILVLRECVTSYTTTLLIENERHQTLRDGLIHLCIQMRPLDGPTAVIRTDPAPGFKALAVDQLLCHHRITLEIGNAKNCNKNPVAEKAVQELESELLRQDPLGGAISPVTLAIATASLNSRIRSRGLSAREMWTRRDQFSNSQIQLNDQDLITKQNQQRLANHPHSETSKAPVAPPRTTTRVETGDLVYLYSDRNKSRAQDRYLVVSVDGKFCNVRKFVGSQLRSTSYRVKTSDCYKVPTELLDIPRHPRPVRYDDSSADEEEPLTVNQSPPSPPNIPDAISTPPTQNMPEYDDQTPSISESCEIIAQPDHDDATPSAYSDDSTQQPRRSL